MVALSILVPLLKRVKVETSLIRRDRSKSFRFSFRTCGYSSSSKVLNLHVQMKSLRSGDDDLAIEKLGLKNLTILDTPESKYRFLSARHNPLPFNGV